VGESLKIRLSYDPRISIETIQADVSCYDYFSGVKGNMALERLEEGNAEAIVQPLPPYTAEISGELLYKVGIEDLLKNGVDVHSVLSETLELPANHLGKLPSMPFLLLYSCTGTSRPRPLLSSLAYFKPA
jgi:hypothetical protein